MKKRIWPRVFLVGILMVFIVGIVTSIILFKNQIDLIGIKSGSEYEKYDKHFIFIASDFDNPMYLELYNGAYEKGKEKGILTEWFGQSLDISYDDEKLLKMALDLDVDGIILCADDTHTLRNLIEEADLREIPLVTVLNDCYGSTRQSYVGISNYNLGREYGREIIKNATKDSKGILILTDSSVDSNSQSVILNGLKETLNNEGNHLKLNISMLEIDNSGAFSSDQQVRQVLRKLDKYPDFVIALSQNLTNSVYQAVVDMNIVGQMQLLGFYTSKNILHEVEKNVLTATIYVDFNKMGATSVEALNEYIETGFVSDFFLIDADTVNRMNVEDYLKDETN